VEKRRIAMSFHLPQVMGIVNINDDSFSGDGTLDVSAAFAQAVRKVEEGADIIDIGAESARTNRKAISVDEEISRLLPFLEKCQELPAKIAVNTWRPDVVRAVLETGRVWMINDIGGLDTDANVKLCSEFGAVLLIMHTKGLPKEPHFEEAYTDVWEDLDAFFDSKIVLALSAGLPREQIVLDPGIDFAKQCADNLAIYRELERLTSRGFPVLLPVSRKTVIGDVLQLPDPTTRDAGTVASIVRGLRAGVSIFRVHNVPAARQTLETVSAIYSSSF